MPLKPPTPTRSDARLSGIPPTCMPCEAVRAFRGFAVPLVQPSEPPPGARRRSAFEADAPLSRLLGQDADEQAMQAWHQRGHPGADLSAASLLGENRSVYSLGGFIEPLRRVHYRDRAWGANAWPSLPLIACPVCWRLNLQRQRKPGDWRSPLCSHGLGDARTGYAPSFTILGPWQLPALLNRLNAADADRHGHEGSPL